MKRTWKRIFSILMTLVLLVLPVCETYASAQGTKGEVYISEVKIGMGKTVEEAAASLEGYTILKSGKKNADLNDYAEGGTGSKGAKAVLLGYKTTTDPKEAITDLAVMNMKGGYSVQEYEALMEKQLKEQIIPFVENFKTTLSEYRENYNSKIAKNKARAKYLHDVLNRFTDDDTGMKLGDLLLNETKYEMGDAAYEALSEEQKKEHADILTILAQGNGNAILIIENLLTRAADTARTTWIDRMSASSLDALMEDLDMLPTDAAKELAKRYDGDAQKILAGWSSLRETLDGYEEAMRPIEEFSVSEYEKAMNAFISITDETPEEEAAAITEAWVNAEKKRSAYETAAQTMAVCEHLRGIPYDDGTMLDFFLQETADLEADISALYPLVAALSPGQRAGLDFVNLFELVCISMTDEAGYKSSSLNSVEEASIYDGIDRTMFEKGGVALTSDALRERAASEVPADENSTLSKWTILSLAISGGCFIAFTASAIAGSFWSRTYRAVVDNVTANEKMTYKYGYFYNPTSWKKAGIAGNKDDIMALGERAQNRAAAQTRLCSGLMTGFAIVAILATIASLYLTYRDLVNYYNVEFTPIPHFMVDEKDITAYNENGQQIVLDNKNAYYKAVTCNRTASDEMFSVLGECADLNGDVGKQWLALYAVKNEAMGPILADSLKVVKAKDSLPAGYKTGIHMFGSDAAFNLNNPLYCWNESAPSMLVYFKTGSAAASGAATAFSPGYFVLIGGSGLLIGLLIGILGAKAVKRKKEQPA